MRGSQLESKRFLILLVGVVLATPTIAHSDSSKVSIEPERTLYGVGETASFTVTNDTGASIFLAGCGALQVQRFEAEAYSPEPGPQCVTEGTAVEVPPGTHTLAYTTEAKQSGAILRAAVSYGWGCEAGRELSQARCDDFATVYTASFRVSRKGS